ncbi:Glutathione S-transferase Mu 3 [Mactra antiquata]
MDDIPELGYWNTRGRAAAIRLLLTYLGEKFKDTQYELGDAPDYSREEWSSVKPKFAEFLDFPNLPYYLDGDIKITQSNAILKHIARKYQLDGETEKEMAIVDMLLNQAMDLRNGIVRLCYDPDYENLKVAYFESLTPTLALCEKRLTSNTWFGGEKVTVADFPFYELLDQLTRMKPDVLSVYPKTTEFLGRFRELKNVKEYLARDEVKNMPINNKMAIFK